MPLFDLPLDQLRGYTSRVTPPADLQDFWDATLDEARTFPLNATFGPVENHLSVIDTFDVTFAGYDGAPIKGWLHLPANRSAGTRMPVVVQYIGYSGGRGLVNQTPNGRRPAMRISSWTPAARATAGSTAKRRIPTRPRARWPTRG